MEQSDMPLPEVQISPPKRPINLLFPGIIIGAVIGGSGVWAFFSFPGSETQIPNVQDTIPTQSSTVPAGWRLYENKEIGITFEYPDTWGNIRVGKEVGCFEAKQEMAASGDPCEQVLLSFGDVREGIFLATQTLLHEKYPIGRGAFFGDEYVGSEEILLGYCSGKMGGNPCTTARNSHGVLVTKSFGVLGFDGEAGWKYLARSPHPYFSSVVLSSSRLNPTWQSDFDRLVDSLKFI